MKYDAVLLPQELVERSSGSKLELKVKKKTNQKRWRPEKVGTTGRGNLELSPPLEILG